MAIFNGEDLFNFELACFRTRFPITICVFILCLFGRSVRHDLSVGCEEGDDSRCDDGIKFWREVGVVLLARDGFESNGISASSRGEDCVSCGGSRFIGVMEFES